MDTNGEPGGPFCWNLRNSGDPIGAKPEGVDIEPAHGRKPLFRGPNQDSSPADDQGFHARNHRVKPVLTGFALLR